MFRNIPIRDMLLEKEIKSVFGFSQIHFVGLLRVREEYQPGPRFYYALTTIVLAIAISYNEISTGVGRGKRFRGAARYIRFTLRERTIALRAHFSSFLLFFHVTPSFYPVFHLLPGLSLHVCKSFIHAPESQSERCHTLCSIMSIILYSSPVSFTGTRSITEALARKRNFTGVGKLVLHLSGVMGQLCLLMSAFMGILKHSLLYNDYWYYVKY